MKPSGTTLLQILMIGFLVFSGAQQAVAEEPTIQTEKKAIPVLHDFGNKIVYSTDAAINTADLQEDCQARGGQFSECGSTCNDTAEACTMVCTLTCEDIPGHTR